jgi:hypothetical protein
MRLELDTRRFLFATLCLELAIADGKDAVKAILK